MALTCFTGEVIDLSFCIKVDKTREEVKNIKKIINLKESKYFPKDIFNNIQVLT